MNKIDYQIPFSKPYINKDDKNSLISVLSGGRLGRGPTVENFEKNFAKYIGTKYAVAVSSGTAGLHLCLRLLNLPAGSEVIMTPFSYISPAYCILYEKLKPVFVDIDKNTLNINPTLIEKAISPKTKAILLVHILGYPCDIKFIFKIAKKYKLKIIEDGCEAIGAEYNNKKVGSFGNPTAFSFYSNKQITTGEGGMICLNNFDDKKLLEALRNQGRSGELLIHEYLGYNYGLDELSAALGLSQLKKVDKILRKREIIARQYSEELKNLSWLSLPYNHHKIKRSWFSYFIFLKNNINREYVIKELKLRGISTRIFFPPIHLQPYIKKIFHFKEGLFPISEKIGKSILSLPLFVDMKTYEIKYICNSLKDIVKKHQ
ncbi:DegT/DnrJ/EryC1/StrS family aminotransferase [Patescibacteria group bacterium]|nr:DegT/DnrJ/EryC1/StrS family aminotransferase [Patescibacteria group bacterium]